MEVVPPVTTVNHCEFVNTEVHTYVFGKPLNIIIVIIIIIIIKFSYIFIVLTKLMGN